MVWRGEKTTATDYSLSAGRLLFIMHPCANVSKRLYTDIEKLYLRNVNTKCIKSIDWFSMVQFYYRGSCNIVNLSVTCKLKQAMPTFNEDF